MNGPPDPDITGGPLAVGFVCAVIFGAIFAILLLT